METKKLQCPRCKTVNKVRKVNSASFLGFFMKNGRTTPNILRCKGCGAKLSEEGFNPLSVEK